jgi:glycine/D-amino acid oxidase-like deaminating enzyme
LKFKFLSKEEVPDFADWGTFYRTLSLDPSVYLHYLQSQCLSLGVTFRRATIDHIRDAFSQGVADTVRADIVVNCSGLWASKLGGVMDDKVVPVRGQIVLVENESHGIFFYSGDENMRKDIGECSYIINRPGGESTILF